MRSFSSLSSLLGLLLAGATLGVTVSCDQLGAREKEEFLPVPSPEPAPKIDDEDIESFVEGEPLAEAQPARRLLKAPTLGVTVFAVSFGEPRDCPSGCFYSTAYGLELQERVAWMGLDAYGQDDSVRTAVRMFDVRSGDSTLFENEIRQHFRRAEESSDRRTAESAYEVFLVMVAASEDTPHEGLLDLAHLLHDEFHPRTGRALLDNPAVRSNRDILEVLAGLSARGTYEDIRDRAQDLLEQLSEGGSSSR